MMKTTFKKALTLLLAALFITGVFAAGLTSYANPFDPHPYNYLKDFELFMLIDDKYTVNGTACAKVTIERGTLKLNDTVWIQTESGTTLSATVTTIIMGGKTFDQAEAGDTPAIGFSDNVKTSDLNMGDAVVGENSHYYQTVRNDEYDRGRVFGILERNDNSDAPIKNGGTYHAHTNKSYTVEVEFVYNDSDDLYNGQKTFAYLKNFRINATFYVGQEIELRANPNISLGTFTVTKIYGDFEPEKGWKDTYNFDFETKEEFNEWTTVKKSEFGLGWLHSSDVVRSITASSGTGAIASFGETVNHTDNWIISPAITLGDNKALMTFDEASRGDKIAVYVGFEPDPDQMIPVYGAVPSDGRFDFNDAKELVNFHYVEHCVDLNAFAGKTIYMAFRQTAGDEDTLLIIDNVKISEDQGTPMTLNPFIDVAPGQWFTKSALWCYSNGYMTGTSDTTFSPDLPFTRAMFVTVLSKIDKADTSTYEGTSFTDVPEGQWFSKPIQWAFKNEFASGLGNGIFGPNNPVTREQLAQFLYNYTVKSGVTASNSADRKLFKDADQVSDWALKAMKWAVGNGLISGIKEGDTILLSPKGTATRAQVAVIILNYIQLIK